MAKPKGTPFAHSRDERQAATMMWAYDAFGNIARDPRERARRFAEEAIELVQSVGLSQKDVLDLVEYVYSRPTGTPYQEVGGVCLSLMALAEFHCISVEQAEDAEFSRVISHDPDHWRAKQQAKVQAGVAE